MADVISDLLHEAQTCAHVVQLYDADERALVTNVARYVCEGLRRGEGGAIIATPEHRDAFGRAIAAEFDGAGRALRDGRLVMLDAVETLDRFMAGEQPDLQRFANAIRPVLEGVRERAGGTALRAYGEMVGVLWQAGRYAAAMQLEDSWNALLEQGGFQLFCAYPIDVFSAEFQIAEVDALLCAHTHLLPAGDGTLQHAVDRAMDDVLGRKADELRRLIKANYRPAWAALPKAEADILWLRNNLPHYADEILARASRYYRAA